MLLCSFICIWLFIVNNGLHWLAFLLQTFSNVCSTANSDGSQLLIFSVSFWFLTVYFSILQISDILSAFLRCHNYLTSWIFDNGINFLGNLVDVIVNCSLTVRSGWEVRKIELFFLVDLLDAASFQNQRAALVKWLKFNFLY